MKKKLLIGCLAIAAIVFLPTTIILVFGMMPTIASFVMDRTVGKNRTICVGSMNFAGCFPFLLDLWTTPGMHQSIEHSLAIIADAKTIIVIYLLAVGGYAIDLAVTGITSSIIAQRSEARLRAIKKQQAEMIDQWGDKVTGKYRLDDFGFPIEGPAGKQLAKQENTEQK